LSIRAVHPHRKQYWVGGSTAVTITANRIIPALLDRYLARSGYGSQQARQKVTSGRSDNLRHPVDGPGGHDHGARGIVDDTSHDRSPQLWMSQHARLLTAAASTAVLGGAAAVRLVRQR
jgi:hypothetical protein